jgi:7-cyano-7-deazaguanine synthase in queuosine biosynthesis
MSTTVTNGTQSGNALDVWRNRLHTVTCPSGQRLRIRIPGVETILQHGDLPDELVEIAILESTHEGGAATAIAEEIPTLGRDEKVKRLAEYAAFQRELVRASIAQVDVGGEWVNVSVSRDDLSSVPDADVEMIAMIALRLRGTDARGVTIGVEPIDRWARFHETHGLDPASCEKCEAFLEGLSSADMGAV